MDAMARTTHPPPPMPKAHTGRYPCISTTPIAQTAHSGTLVSIKQLRYFQDLATTTDQEKCI
ncbi:hypothetical protein DPMN_049064 [Dreissena polymorpha]|uniref:Uncharacterized protein n=1 Tax=Dreissena polymorpha TaxID=45954 RepID=A0A9D4DEI7_DREPO|nr:hypothetical protein DPMN_049064 [Dreissena polymorpha]